MYGYPWMVVPRHLFETPCLEQNKQCILCKFKLQMEHGHWVIDLLGDRRSHLSWLGLPCFVVFSLLSFK